MAGVFCVFADFSTNKDARQEAQYSAVQWMLCAVNMEVAPQFWVELRLSHPSHHVVFLHYFRVCDDRWI